MGRGIRFFLEMNTRLQVEHPVTELVWGVDLVEWQIRVAQGQPLPMRQEQLVPRGHAVEVRLCAEDPTQNFAPQTGRIAFWNPTLATQHAGVRVDDGVRAGDDVSPFYDSMLAKVMAHGVDREDAVRRVTAALEDSPLLGVTTNARFLCSVMATQEFRNARMTTTTLDAWVAQKHELVSPQEPPDVMWRLAAALHVDQPRGFLTRGMLPFDLTLQCGTQPRVLRMEPSQSLRVLDWFADARVHFEWEGIQQHAVAVRVPGGMALSWKGFTATFVEPLVQGRAGPADDATRIKAPITGTVVALNARPQMDVKPGDVLVVLEAMKMETRLTASAAGQVTAVNTQLGKQVATGDVLVELTLATPGASS